MFRSRFRSTLAVSVLAAATVAVIVAVAPAKDAASPTLVKRGAYLVRFAGCGDCHTPGTFYGAPDMKRALSGSEIGWQGPWGVSYARNLTPDAATGLGKWSEADIVRAIRTGIRPDGRLLNPPMPWQGFAGLSDEDAMSIAAYLKSLPAVHHKVPDGVPPGTKADGSIIVFPPPTAWDAPRGMPPAGKK
ncbi:MAG: cytochrome c [Candidatus Eisenbacteria bacterium]|nr:cytochrome c [Candidatus Eisenbacteria bacterium]